MVGRADSGIVGRSANGSLTDDGLMDDYARQVNDLAGAIKLGYEVERGHAAAGFAAPSDAEAEWLAAWIISEGWSRVGQSE